MVDAESGVVAAAATALFLQREVWLRSGNTSARDWIAAMPAAMRSTPGEVDPAVTLPSETAVLDLWRQRYGVTGVTPIVPGALFGPTHFVYGLHTKERWALGEATLDTPPPDSGAFVVVSSVRLPKRNEKRGTKNQEERERSKRKHKTERSTPALSGIRRTGKKFRGRSPRWRFGKCDGRICSIPASNSHWTRGQNCPH